MNLTPSSRSPGNGSSRRRQSTLRQLLAVLCGLWLGLPSSSLLGAESGVEDKEIFGWVEQVLIGELQLAMDAKLDTGADTSSLHAEWIRRTRDRDGDRWVEFLIADPDSGRRVRFKKHLVRTSTIKEHGGSRQRRPVVLLEVCLGTHERKIEVNLVDRSSFDYPMLLGRNALEGLALVDSAVQHTVKPACPIRED